MAISGVRNALCAFGGPRQIANQNPAMSAVGEVNRLLGCPTSGAQRPSGFAPAKRQVLAIAAVRQVTRQRQELSRVRFAAS